MLCSQALFSTNPCNVNVFVSYSGGHAKSILTFSVTEDTLIHTLEEGLEVLKQVLFFSFPPPMKARARAVYYHFKAQLTQKPEGGYISDRETQYILKQYCKCIFYFKKN